MSKASPILLATDWLFDIVALRLLPRLAYWSDGDRFRLHLVSRCGTGTAVVYGLAARALQCMTVDIEMRRDWK